MIPKINSHINETTFGYNEARSYRWFKNLEQKYPGWREHPKRAIRQAKRNGELLTIQQQNGVSIVGLSKNVEIPKIERSFLGKLLSIFKTPKNS